MLADAFEVVEEDDKMKSMNPNVFGFFGINYTVKLKNPPKEQTEIKDFLFEIQVRTISQDTWAVISHDLDYKTSQPIQGNLRRDLFALSGLLHVADTHFDVLRKNNSKN